MAGSMSCQDTTPPPFCRNASRRPWRHTCKTFPDGNFLPGTLVASSQGHLPDVGDSAP
jgi:hypothetical protein